MRRPTEPQLCSATPATQLVETQTHTHGAPVLIRLYARFTSAKPAVLLGAPPKPQHEQAPPGCCSTIAALLNGPDNTAVHLQGAPQRLLAKRAHLRALSGATACSASRSLLPRRCPHGSRLPHDPDLVTPDGPLLTPTTRRHPNRSDDEPPHKFSTRTGPGRPEAKPKRRPRGTACRYDAGKTKTSIHLNATGLRFPRVIPTGRLPQSSPDRSRSGSLLAQKFLRGSTSPRSTARPDLPGVNTGPLRSGTPNTLSAATRKYTARYNWITAASEERLQTAPKDPSPTSRLNYTPGGAGASSQTPLPCRVFG